MGGRRCECEGEASTWIWGIHHMNILRRWLLVYVDKFVINKLTSIRNDTI